MTLRHVHKKDTDVYSGKNLYMTIQGTVIANIQKSGENPNAHQKMDGYPKCATAIQ